MPPLAPVTVSIKALPCRRYKFHIEKEHRKHWFGIKTKACPNQEIFHFHQTPLYYKDDRLPAGIFKSTRFISIGQPCLVYHAYPLSTGCFFNSWQRKRPYARTAQGQALLWRDVCQFWLSALSIRICLYIVCR